MNTPKRWIETESGSSELERELLRPALDVEVPDGAEQRVWMGLLTLLPLSATAVASSVGGATGAAAAGSSGAAAVQTAGAAATSGGAAGAGKLGFIMVAKAFAIGATSGALVVGGYTALDASRENVPVERTIETARDHASPGAATSRSSSSTNVASPTPTVTSPSSTSPSPPAAFPNGGSSTSRPAPGRSAQNETFGLAVPRPAAENEGSFAALPTPAPPPKRASDLQASRLGEEARALKRARDALRAGDLGAAFAALEAARSAFPRGALGEEREALMIQLLAESGQRAQARARAESFLRSFPNSPHAPRVRQLAGSLPP